jgi:CubicO group peptidase (beta-lactamase class C family)
VPGLSIQGEVEPGFHRVRDAFAANFAKDAPSPDLGAALAVFVHGKPVIRLFGGFRDGERLQPWISSTLVNIWSASKAVLAVAIAQQVDAGKLDYDQRIADVWPEFAAEGKESITLNHVLGHQAGLNGFAEPTTSADLFDWQLVTARLARQRPFWPPGTLTSYHGMTFGWLCGEILRRVSGLEPRDYYRRHIAQPLRADLWLGCPPGRRPEAAVIVPPEPDRSPAVLSGIAARTVVNPAPDAAIANTEAWRAAQVPAVNVHATAEGLGRLYAALANRGTLDGARILSPAAVDSLRTMRSPGPDELLGPRRWAAGVALNHDGQFGPDPEAFGHAGWGGSVGFASARSGVAFAYVVNRMGSRLNGDRRARLLCDAVFESV